MRGDVLGRELKVVLGGGNSGRPYHRGKLRGTRSKDATCVVLDGTEILFASEAERFSKIKHDYARPYAAYEAYLLNTSSTDEPQRYPDGKQLAPLNHHLNHVYECFYLSGFSEAAVLVNDGKGNLNDCLTCAYMKEGEEPLVLKKFDKLNSPCALYHHASAEIFHNSHAEGKMMGLAAYGKDNHKEYVKFDDDAKDVVVNIDMLDGDFEATREEFQESTKDVMWAKDIAFTVQKNFEDTLVNVVLHMKELLDEKGIKTENLCLSGGGVLNCPTNSKIVDLGIFKHFYASPQPSDGAAESAGRAFREMECRGEKLKSKRLKSAYLGATYKGNLENSDMWLERLLNPNEAISAHLSDGGVVAWYQGGAEWGPRALGHRSFLANPTTTEMLDALNKIKGREKWRPLAPIVPEELFARLFEGENYDMCEFMLRTLTIKESWRRRMQAVSHADGSTRPQLLKQETNPELHDLLTYHFEHTNVPCLINTSLNINGFPIVETPYDFKDLAEEVSFMTDIPKVMYIYVKDDEVFEFLSKTQRKDN